MEVVSLEHILFDDLAEARPFLATDTGKSIPRQVDQIPRVVDDKVIDGLRFSRCHRRLGKFFSLRKHIDERRLADVRTPYACELRLVARRALLYIGVTGHEFSPGYFHGR